MSRPFQIIGVDVMDLPKTAQGNKHVLVFQDLFTKWPMVFAIPDQTTDRIVRILVDEIVPFCGVPEALLSDRGTNLLSHMMLETCELLGTKKLNTTAYHPQCDGLVERYNRTLKTTLRKHAARFWVQWDRLLSGVVWAYRNTPHEATQEKPSYLLFGMDCRTPTEAAMLPPSVVQLTDVSTYREELTVSLASARNLAASSIRQAQKKYKKSNDRKVVRRDYRVGDWVLVRFPHEEMGKGRKLSRPWHGPYRVVEANEPDVTVVKVYRPQDGQIYRSTRQESRHAPLLFQQATTGTAISDMDLAVPLSGSTSCYGKTGIRTRRATIRGQSPLQLTRKSLCVSLTLL